MSKSFILFLTSIALAALLFPAFYFNGQAEQAKQNALIQKCKDEGDLRTEQKDIGPWNAFIVLKCHPSGISSLNYQQMTPTQREIYSSSNGDYWFNNWAASAWSIIIVGSIPLAWAFFLERIRELSRAIRGIK